MSGRTPKLEWLVAESEAEWARMQRERAASNATSQPLLPAWCKRRHLVGACGLVLVLLIGIGYLYWRNARAERQQIYTEVQAVEDQQIRLINQELLTLPNHLIDPQVERTWRDYFASEWVHTFTNQQGGNTITDSKIQQVQVQGDTALVQILLSVQGADAITHTLRTTRFYRRTAAGWQRTNPDLRFWGAAERMETAHFRFDFHTRDTPAVLAVADHIDERYLALRHTFGLPPPGQEKVTITVAVETAPLPNMYLTYKRGTMVVPAPALQQTLVSLTETEILDQSIALHLSERVLKEWFDTVKLDYESVNWQQLQFALRLWQIWAFDGPLAVGRYPIVHELYADRYGAARDHNRRPPTHYSQICMTYQAWHLSPDLLLPMTCSEYDPYLWYAQVALLHLKPLAQPTNTNTELSEMDRGQSEVIALTTMIEYIVTEYGQEVLPDFLNAFSQQKDWETLIQTVFHYSVTEFEAGWHQYLVDQYDIVLP